MKSIFTAISIIAIVIFFAISPSIFAQAPDTVWISASPVGNLNEFIMGDTTSTGARLHPNAVYKLYRDSIYYFTGTMNVSFPLTIIAGGSQGALPVIEPAILSDNSRPHYFINLKAGGLTLKQLYLFGVAPDEIPVRPGKAVIVLGDSMNVKVDSCVFDGWSYGSFMVYGSMNSFWITDNIFRNMQDYTSYYYGDTWISFANIPTDTVYIVNNTIFCDEGYAFASLYYNKYTFFNHNTIFLNGAHLMSMSLITNGDFSNNIFYGIDADGSIPIIGLTSLGNVGTQYSISEADRHLKIDNNAYFWPQDMQNAWQTINDTSTSHADSILAPGWITSYAQSLFDDTTFVAVATTYEVDTTFAADTTVASNTTVDTTYIYAADTTFAPDTTFASDTTFATDTTIIANKTIVVITTKTTKRYPYFEDLGNINADPGFSSSITSATGNLMHYIYLIRTGGLKSSLWWYNPTGSVYPPTQPVPENLAYSNATLQHAGSDGFAIGDLNWFPDQHKQWLSPITDVKNEKSAAPTEYILNQNYPNPFNPSTVISYAIPKQGNVELKIYNILGQEVSTLVNQMQAAGSHEVTFNANSLSSGVYFYTLRSGDFMQVKKMMLLK